MPPKASSSAVAAVAALGLDPGVAALDAGLAARAVMVAGPDGDEYDAKLAQVNLANNTDKYYVLQFFTDGTRGSNYLYSRWGRTGTAGQSKLEDFGGHAAKALAGFNKLYKQKTGLGWAQRDVGGDMATAAAALKYVHLATSKTRAAAGSWEYYTTHDPMGKPDGWHPYDAKAAAEAEELHRDFQENPSMHTRFIFAESSGYTYKVDLVAGTQTNTTSNKARPVRRTPPPGEKASAKKSQPAAKKKAVAVPKSAKKTAAAAKSKAAPKAAKAVGKVSKAKPKAVVVPKKSKASPKPKASPKAKPKAVVVPKKAKKASPKPKAAAAKK